MGPRPAAAPLTLEKGAVDVAVDNDPAYIAIVDPASYAKDLPDWDYDSLTALITKQMNAGRIVAWGTPEDSLRVRITTTPLSTEARARINASFIAHLATAGTLCLANYTSLTMCAQFGDYDLPRPGDPVFRVPAGAYAVEINRTFPHREGQQFGDADPRSGEPHYIVVLQADGGIARAPAVTWVPWALRPSTGAHRN